jgi:hypothetical protein
MTGRPVECVKMTLPFRLLDWNPSDRSVSLKLLYVFLGRFGMSSALGCVFERLLPRSAWTTAALPNEIDLRASKRNKFIPKDRGALVGLRYDRGHQWMRGGLS